MILTLDELRDYILPMVQTIIETDEDLPPAKKSEIITHGILHLIAQDREAHSGHD